MFTGGRGNAGAFADCIPDDLEAGPQLQRVAAAEELNRIGTVGLVVDTTSKATRNRAAVDNSVVTGADDANAASASHADHAGGAVSASAGSAARAAIPTGYRTGINQRIAVGQKHANTSVTTIAALAALATRAPSAPSAPSATDTAADITLVR